MRGRRGRAGEGWPELLRLGSGGRRSWARRRRKEAPASVACGRRQARATRAAGRGRRARGASHGPLRAGGDVGAGRHVAHPGRLGAAAAEASCAGRTCPARGGRG